LKRKRRVGLLLTLGILAGAGGGGYLWIERETSPMPDGKEILVRFDKAPSFLEAMDELRTKGVIRSSSAMSFYTRVYRKARVTRSGTFKFKPGMTRDQILASLAKPVQQMFRCPETNWAKRTANLLERANVTLAKDYMSLWAQPESFRNDYPKLPLPVTGSLEGFLYPDTYDFPPLLGAKGVIDRQLANFEKRVMPLVSEPDKLYRALIVASMVELEVAKDSERPLVAGVIENRLRLKMPLQIDATINYGLQEWRPLTYADLKADGPYNTYTRLGLPPTPICSPTVDSIKAALNPAKHNYLYYVAMPEKYHLFAATFDEHRRNIAKRKAALKALGQ